MITTIGRQRRARSTAAGTRRKAAARTSTAVDPRLIEEIEKYLKGHHPGVGVDALLTRPIAAMELALHVGVQRDRLDRDTAETIVLLLAGLTQTHAHAIDVVNDICRAAMNGRKQGKLKPAVGSSPASRAAATRKQRQQKGAQQ